MLFHGGQVELIHFIKNRQSDCSNRTEHLAQSGFKQRLTSILSAPQRREEAGGLKLMLFTVKASSAFCARLQLSLFTCCVLAGAGHGHDENERAAPSKLKTPVMITRMYMLGYF